MVYKCCIVSESPCISKIDLKNAYFEVELSEESVIIPALQFQDQGCGSVRGCYSD